MTSATFASTTFSRTTFGSTTTTTTTVSTTQEHVAQEVLEVVEDHSGQYTNMVEQFGNGWCADASGRQFDSWHGPFIRLDWCKAFCSKDPHCLGFDYIAKPNHCEPRYGNGDLPATNPGPFWHKYENGQAEGPIAQVVADGTERMCYRKNLGQRRLATLSLSAAPAKQARKFLAP
jgi:hypothetical protein